MSAPDFRAAILATLGHAPEAIEPGRFHRFATSDRRSDDAGWCKLFDDERGGVFGCHRQSVSARWKAADSVATREPRAKRARNLIAATAEREALQAQQWEQGAQRIARIWAQCEPLVQDDPCALYLARRGFNHVSSLPKILRLHRALPYWHGAEKLGTFPAMVTPLVAFDGRMVALHRTYLTPDGRKANVPNPKKLTGTVGSLAGACIPLHEPERGCIGIAEGVETALAGWRASAMPTVASYCAGNLKAWHWPAGVRHLVIFGDADRVGRDAAEALRTRAVAAKLSCEVLIPTTEGADWADVWAAGGGGG